MEGGSESEKKGLLDSKFSYIFVLKAFQLQLWLSTTQSVILLCTSSF